MEPIERNPRIEPDPPELARLQRGRSTALWTMVAGFGAMFLGGGLLPNIAIGGAVMVGIAILMLGYYAWRIRAVRPDPWKDPDIDAWEKEEMHPKGPGPQS